MATKFLECSIVSSVGRVSTAEADTAIQKVYHVLTGDEGTSAGGLWTGIKRRTPTGHGTELSSELSVPFILSRLQTLCVAFNTPANQAQTRVQINTWENVWAGNCRKILGKNPALCQLRVQTLA